MIRRKPFGGLFVLAAAAISGCGGWVEKGASPPNPAPAAGLSDGARPVRLSPQARKNLNLVSKPLQLSTYWRKLDVPGVIVERPGVSDRGVIAPATGVVTRMHAFPGDTVKPAAPLFSLRLVSESLYASQLELFKAAREIELAEERRGRISPAAQAGALAQSRVIEIENQIERLGVTVQAYRQDLQARGLSPEHISAAAKGSFVTEIVVRAPGEQALRMAETAGTSGAGDEAKAIPFNFELERLHVELGEQVQTGRVLCDLADHRALLIEGKGFRDDLPIIQEAAKNGWEVELELGALQDKNWPEPPQRLQIDHVLNSVDVQSRTFAFLLPLENQWQAYTRHGEAHLLWRFRPGDRVRLRVAVEKLDEVFVLPQAALVREGPEAFVFRQNGDFFDRRPVHVLHEDSLEVVLANDGSLRPGFAIAQNGAASLNRVLKAQAASGMPANVHVHPDGTVHEAH